MPVAPFSRPTRIGDLARRGSRRTVSQNALRLTVAEASPNAGSKVHATPETAASVRRSLPVPWSVFGWAVGNVLVRGVSALVEVRDTGVSPRGSGVLASGVRGADAGRGNEDGTAGRCENYAKPSEVAHFPSPSVSLRGGVTADSAVPTLTSVVPQHRVGETAAGVPDRRVGEARRASGLH